MFKIKDLGIKRRWNSFVTETNTAWQRGGHMVAAHRFLKFSAAAKKAELLAIVVALTNNNAAESKGALLRSRRANQAASKNARGNIVALAATLKREKKTVIDGKNIQADRQCADRNLFFSAWFVVCAGAGELVARVAVNAGDNQYRKAIYKLNSIERDTHLDSAVVQDGVNTAAYVALRTNEQIRLKQLKDRIEQQIKVGAAIAAKFKKEAEQEFPDAYRPPITTLIVGQDTNARVVGLQAA